MLKKLIPLNKRFCLTKYAAKLFSSRQPKITKPPSDSSYTSEETFYLFVKESLKKEMDNYYPVDENQLKSILNSKGFSFVNEENSKVFKLEKKVDDKLVRVIITPKQPDFAQSEGENQGKIF